jgi:glycosyltransferase
MKISIITAVLNDEKNIEACINSVLEQTYEDIEYIVIDGCSIDGTREIIKNYERSISQWVSEPDHGIYFAINKGIKLSSGEVIGILHADDMYASNNVIAKVVSQITKEEVDSCYGDLVYVHHDSTDKVIRYWKSCSYQEGMFRRGWMPPHPTFFVRKDIYEQFGYFNTNFKISADYELMLRLFEKNKISFHYIPEVLVKMRMGGVSNRNIKNMLIKSSEDLKAWKVNGLKRSLYTIPLKNISKVPQFLKKH